MLDAEEKILSLEKDLFADVRRRAGAEAQRIRATAAAVAELDVTAALAQVAAENRYHRPRFSDTGEMRILAGRHPVIERLSGEEAGRFIPNDLYLNNGSNLIAIITGPNMGGKSTYLRQAALIAILAQMGSYVPAEEAELPLIDRIFTRIGASDNLARGRSTFMVEMTETAAILNTATSRSFIVLDEIGRGTATYDGLALAWAVVEHIHARTRAKTLFATHYHELTELAEQLEGVGNLRVTVKEAGDHIIFLRKVEPGKADRSYGIEVARLAGLPLEVIERAREVLKLHERTEHAVSRGTGESGRDGAGADPALRAGGVRHCGARPQSGFGPAAADRGAGIAGGIAEGTDVGRTIGACRLCNDLRSARAMTDRCKRRRSVGSWPRGEHQDANCGHHERDVAGRDRRGDCGSGRARAGARDRVPIDGVSSGAAEGTAGGVERGHAHRHGVAASLRAGRIIRARGESRHAAGSGGWN